MEQSSKRLSVKAGDAIFAEDDAPTTAFLIEVGRVVVSTIQHGEYRQLGELGPGALLGEMAVIDSAPRSATAHALTDCELTPIDRNQFAERLAAADPVVRALLMSQLTRYRSALATLTGAALSETELKPSENSAAFDKIRLESELRSALERDELEVLLQPLLHIPSGIIAGYEALIRWQHPTRGAVSPNEFIRLAEETSLIIPIGDYVLARVCDMLVDLRNRGREPLPFIALNVSARQLDDPTLVDRMLDHLRSRDLPPDRLEVEITESLVFNQKQIGQLLDRCHAAGMEVALDDFGTGYSNLGPVLELSFDRIKLDQAFTRSLHTKRGHALVSTIVAMTKALGCEMIAEGVEEVSQLEALRELGCDYAQGWLVGKPISLQQVLETG
ncbi:MAG TPA: EAL domain-containing protein [Dokdonella sp.]|uniref:EAL domain-containing protein n=1 Tax=Dokdonella sp. TaxID=2291710 RepID=UPI002D804B47|nr:EAL domain-containing protein [Dokdonella sp.]HET9032192.1 EAL domain-containing protein [Dokdonella sp.]